MRGGPPGSVDGATQYDMRGHPTGVFLPRSPKAPSPHQGRNPRNAFLIGKDPHSGSWEGMRP